MLKSCPIIRRDNYLTVVAASLQNSFIWSRLQVLRLRQNMRLNAEGNNAAFGAWLGRMSYEKKLIGRTKLPLYRYLLRVKPYCFTRMRLSLSFYSI